MAMRRPDITFDLEVGEFLQHYLELEETLTALSPNVRKTARSPPGPGARPDASRHGSCGAGSDGRIATGDDRGLVRDVEVQ